MEDRLEAARQVMRDLDIGQEWETVVEDGMPPELGALTAEMIDAYRRADVEWVLEHADPNLEITQLEDLPDAKTYRGHEGLIDALLDWPRQWEDFQIEPRRVFSIGHEHVLVVGIHRGRPGTIDIEVEAQIVFLMRWRGRLLTDWNMFTTESDAVAAANAR